MKDLSPLRVFTSIVKLILIKLYVKAVGIHKFRMGETSVTLRLTLDVRNRGLDVEYMRFKVRQNKHITKYMTRCYPKKIKYTYSLTVDLIKDNNVVAKEHRCYPHIPPKLFSSTTLAHRLCIHSFIDEYSKQHKESKD